MESNICFDSDDSTVVGLSSFRIVSPKHLKRRSPDLQEISSENMGNLLGKLSFKLIALLEQI